MMLLAWEKALIEAIHRYGGFVTDDYATQFFLASRDDETAPKTNNYVNRRKRMLVKNRYLRRVSPDEMKGYVLGVEGARLLAAREGKTLTGKNRFLYRRKQPRYVLHEWREGQAHIRLEKASESHKRIKLHSYRHDLELRRFPIKVDCYDPERKEHYTREVVPDSLADLDFRMRPYSLPIEIDMGTRFDPNITRYKLIPCMFYHRAEKRTFWGREPNVWIWITTREVRLKHLKEKTEEMAIALKNPTLASQLIFTTWEQFTADNIFKQPIWYQGGRDNPDYLFSCCDYATCV